MAKVAIFSAMLLMVAATTPVRSSETECYDVKVSAKAIAQIPTVFPEDDDPDVIIMSWPWFVDLRVSRVLDGDIQRNKMVTALAVMHVSFVKKTRTWLLRKNSVGTFNVLRPESPELVARCEADAVPAKPYITPSPDQSYADLRREGENAYREYFDEPKR